MDTTAAPKLDPERLVNRNFLALGSGEAFARAIAFGATIYIARSLGASLYGVIGFATAITLYLSRIADGGIEFFGLGVREIAADRQRIKTVAPSLLSARLMISAVLTVLVSIGAAFLPQPEGAVLAVYGLTLLMIGASTRWIHYGLESTHVAAMSRGIGEILMLVIVVVLVRNPGDVARVPLAQFVGDGTAVLILAWWLMRRGFSLPMRLDWRVVLPLFRRSWRLVVSALLGLMIYNADIIILRVVWDSATVGYYAVAYLLISFCVNLGGAYAVSLLPTLTRLEPDAQRSLYQTATAYAFAVTCPIAVGGFLLGGDIIQLIFGSPYALATIPLAILIWTIPASTLLTIPTVALMVQREERRVLTVTATAAVLNLILNIFLIPSYGMIGAALATLAAEWGRFAMALVFAAQSGMAPVRLGRFSRPLLSAMAMGGLIAALRPLGPWTVVPLGILAYTVTLAIMGGIRFQRGRLPTLSV